MAHRLPSNLSPKAKKLLLTADAGQPVRALVQVAPTADTDVVELDVAALGGTVAATMGHTGLLSCDLPAGRLGELAGISGVVYVETGEIYGS
ncbi:hypothetical protein BH23ACT10_BH23ACT10_19900 [soil metagenome]